MDVSKYPRDKIGLLIKISRMEQGLERAELSARTGINISQLFRIENGQSVLNNYEIAILFDELLIDKKHFSQKDSYLNMIFDQYVDNYIYGLKLDNEILMKQAYEFESDYECSINYYKWVCLKYFDGVISRQNDDKFLSLESIIVKVKGGFLPIEQQLCGIFLSLRKSREYKYNEAISILNSCLNSNDNKLLGIIYYYLFTNYTQNNENDLAYSFLTKALEQFKLENNFIGITECICHFGVYSSRKGAYKLAESYFYEAIKLARILNKENLMGMSYYNLSWCKICEKKYDDVYPMAEKAMQYIDDGDLYFNIAFAYYKLRKSKDLIIEYIKKGKTRVNKKNILYEEFSYIEYALDHTKEETVSYLYTMLHKVEKKANRDDCFLLFTELLDLLEELHRTEEVVIIQKSLMELS